MGSDYGGPDFSYAYGGSPSSASWNPALRPDHDEQSPVHEEPLTHPSGAVQEPLSHPEPNNAAETDLPVASVKELPAADRFAAFENEPTSGDDFFDHFAHPEQAGQDNGVSQTPMADGFDKIDSGVSTSAVPDTLSESANMAHNESNIDHDIQEEHPPAENYEHQGESTFLEDAIQENAKAPLATQAETLSLDWETSGEVFDLGGKQQDGPVADLGITADKVGEATTPEIDWGTTEEDDFNFGVEASHGRDSHNDGGSQQGLWDLALDDDFLPENVETVPPFDIDDDPGFLEDLPAQPVPEASLGSASKYAPIGAQAPKPITSPYGVQAPQFTDFSQIDQRSIPSPVTPFGAYNQSPQLQQQLNRPAIPSSALSFADKAKGGYHSPYDLPEDIVKTRRRPAPHHASTPTAQPTLPPPRTSSMYSNTSAGATRPLPPSNMSAASLSPPSSSHSMQPQMNGLAPAATQQPPIAKAASSDFFAELPITSKPRHHAPPSGRYTPQHGMPTPPPGNYVPQAPPNQRADSWASQTQSSQAQPAPLIAQLQPPERLPAFPDLGTSPTRSNSLPVPPSAPVPVPSRYSPAPPSAPGSASRYSPAPPTTAPGSGPRYSPVPPPQAPPAPTLHRYSSEPPRPHPQPFAPRTSSPLAFHSEQAQPSGQHAASEQGHHTMPSADGVPKPPLRRPLEGVSEVEEQGPSQAPTEYQSRPPMTARSATPPMRSSPSSTVGSPRKQRQSYTPQYQPGPPPPSAAFSPPRRSQTQSPGATMKNPVPASANVERRASAHDLASPTSSPPAQSVASIIPHRRQFSRDFDYITPTDERASDPLQRWKGHPIFQWGVGGTVVTSFPKHIPRYGTGSAFPMMKANPGEVRIQTMKEACPLADDIAKFPGPLKAKSKKKAVSTWLSGKIGALENDFKDPAVERALSPADLKRFEEKILLWKLMQILVDNDGHLEGNPAVELAVRKALSPHGVEDSSEPTASYSTAADLVGRSRSASTNVQAEPVDPRAVDELRNLLTRGDREKAVWHAVDQRLWAHAMLLSSTLDKNIWKQVVQEFVRKEVKKIGGNTQALAVLYEVFAGNWEDCIDELVPASARAGFQMMSTDGNGAPRNALQGLDRWQETLLLILSNRSEGDVQALISLGRLLAGYGRVEAAHICFVFAKSTAYLGGVDDPQSDLVLLGADHRANPENIGKELEPVLLTEVYEFALSLSAPSVSTVIPHLQNFKLAHAFTLAEYGYRSEAQQYCDAIAAAIKATTRASPYYNSSFIMLLDDLTMRLSQAPKDGSSSWISKPSMDKLSGSLFSRLNNFIAGDESDGASNHSGTGLETGPFAKIAGNTPTISPVHSNADIYGTYGQYPGAPAAATPSNSRYAPGASAAPRGSLDQARSRYDPQSQSTYQASRPSMESSDDSQSFRRSSENYMPSPQLGSAYTPSAMPPPSQRTSMSHTQSLYSPSSPEVSTMHAPYANPYQPASITEAAVPSSDYQPLKASFTQNSASPPAGDRSPAGYEPPAMGGYEPPTGAYEPPTYEPYQPDAAEDTSPVLEKKKSFMDDDGDDDIARRAADLKKQQKSEADKKADEAFRKAAEADAAKDKNGGQKAGWFGGWFKKEANATPGPIKAKLGEESSFVYDTELGKWVNKKAGTETASAPRATPPPPKTGPPSRSVSGNSVAANHALGQLGSSLPHSYSAPGTRPPTSTPGQRSSSMPPPSAPGSRSATPARSGTPGLDDEKMPPTLMPPNLPSGPPSRPGTGLSTASSIDDLLSEPQMRPGGTVKKNKKRGGRYIDVMAQQ